MTSSMLQINDLSNKKEKKNKILEKSSARLGDKSTGCWLQIGTCYLVMRLSPGGSKVL